MTDSSRPLSTEPRSVSHPIQIVLRVLLAGIFLYAAVPKLLHPDQFAENLLDYALLPVQWVNLVAIWLPTFELVVGLMLLSGLWLRAGALSMMGMGAIFLGGLVWVQSGPTPLPCSCFSTDPGAEPRTWFSLWQEAVIVLLAAALWVSHWPHTGEPPIHMRKRQIIGLVSAVSIVVLLMVGVVVARHQRVEQASALARQEDTVITAARPLPRLLDLGSPTCEACQGMAPALEELTRELEGKVIVQFVDIEKHAEYVDRHDLVAIPTQIFFDAQGKQVGRHEGVLTKAEALEQLRKLGLL
jgi:thioredoxin 1